MKRVFWLAMSLWAAALPVAAGTLAGTVAGHGPASPADSDPTSGGYGSMRYKFAEKVDYDRLRDFVVYIDQPVPGPRGPVAARLRTVTQRDVTFDPHVLPIAVGTRVTWPNADSIYHNVFSYSEAKEFNLGMHTDREPAEEVVFDKPGRVDVFCSIHAMMHCIILVVPSPYFTKANAHHRYAIGGIPAGTYRIKAWHERMPPEVRTVTIPAEGEVQLNFDLGLARLPRQ